MHSSPSSTISLSSSSSSSFSSLSSSLSSYLFLFSLLLLSLSSFPFVSCACSTSSTGVNVTSAQPYTCITPAGAGSIQLIYKANCQAGSQDQLCVWTFSSCSANSGSYYCTTYYKYYYAVPASQAATTTFTSPVSLSSAFGSGFTSFSTNTQYFVGYTLNNGYQNAGAGYLFTTSSYCITVTFTSPVACITAATLNLTATFQHTWSADLSVTNDWLAIYDTADCTTTCNNNWGDWKLLTTGQNSNTMLLNGAATTNFNNKMSGTFAVYYLNGSPGASGTHTVRAVSQSFQMVGGCANMTLIFPSPNSTCVSQTTIYNMALKYGVNTYTTADFFAIYKDSECGASTCSNNWGPSASAWATAGIISGTMNLNGSTGSSFALVAGATYSVYLVTGSSQTILNKGPSFTLSALCGSVFHNMTCISTRTAQLINATISINSSSNDYTVGSTDWVAIYKDSDCSGMTCNNNYGPNFKYLPHGWSGTFTLPLNGTSSITMVAGTSYSVYYLRGASNPIALVKSPSFTCAAICGSITAPTCVSVTNLNSMSVTYTLHNLETTSAGDTDFLAIFLSSDCVVGGNCPANNFGPNNKFLTAGITGSNTVTLSASALGSSFTNVSGSTYIIAYARGTSGNTPFLMGSSSFVMQAFCLAALAPPPCLSTLNYFSLSSSFTGLGNPPDLTTAVHFIALYRTTDCNSLSCNGNFGPNNRFFEADLSSATVALAGAVNGSFAAAAGKNYSLYYLRGTSAPYFILNKSPPVNMSVGGVCPGDSSFIINMTTLAWIHAYSPSVDGNTPTGTPILTGSSLIMTATNVQTPTTACGFINFLNPTSGSTTQRFNLTDGTTGCAPAILSGPIPTLSNTYLVTTTTGGTNGFGMMLTLPGTGAGSAVVIYTHANADDVPIGALISNQYNTSDLFLYGVDYTNSLFKINICNTANCATKTYLYTFATSIGYFLNAPLMFLPTQCLYSTSQFGGANNLGTLWRYCVKTNVFTSLYSFKGVSGTEAGNLLGGLINGGGANANTLFGLGSEGGSFGFGSYFSYATATSTTTHLYSFNNSVDGSFPSAGLTQGRTNNTFYGVTRGSYTFMDSSTSTVYGSVFRVFANGTFQSVFTFDYNTCAQPTGIWYDSVASLASVNAVGVLYINCYTGSTNKVGATIKLYAKPDP